MKGKSKAPVDLLSLKSEKFLFDEDLESYSEDSLVSTSIKTVEINDYTTGTKRSEHISLISSLFKRKRDFQSDSLSTNMSEDSVQTVINERKVINIKFSDLHPEVRLTRIKNKYIQKVYGILCIQFLAVLAVLLTVNYVDAISNTLSEYDYILASVFLYKFNFSVLAAYLIFSQQLRQLYPMNLILMSSLTISHSLGHAAFCYHFSILKTSILSYTIFSIVTFLGFLSASQNKWDVTRGFMYVWLIFCCISISGAVTIIIVYFHFKGKLYLVVFSGVELLLFTLLMLCVTRRLAVDQTGHIATEKVIFGTLVLYVDVLLIFQIVKQAIKCCRGFFKI